MQTFEPTTNFDSLHSATFESCMQAHRMEAVSVRVRSVDAYRVCRCVCLCMPM